MKTENNQSNYNSEYWQDVTETVVNASLQENLLKTGLIITSTIAPPLGATVAVAGLATYGVMKVVKWLND